MEHAHYVIRGGVEGRERLSILSRVMQPTTLSLFGRVGIEPGMTCLDVGCGGGDVTHDLGYLVGPKGKAVGSDVDAISLELARGEAEQKQVSNIEFRQADIVQHDGVPEFDVVYARFLLTHLRNPAGALANMQRFLWPGGVVIVEDIDFTGHFCHPDSAAFGRYIELYTQSVKRSGGDPNIGPRLPGLLLEAGFENVQMNVVQPAGMEGEVKFINPITMENIVDTVLAEGLASQDEVDRIIDELYEYSRDPMTVASLPRLVQAWGYRPRE